METIRRLPWTLALAAITLVGAGLRFYGLNSQLWYDEIVTLVESARLPVWNIVTTFPSVNTHPLYSVLGHLSMSVLGESPWALRLPACLFGIASVVMTALLAARLTSRAEGLVAAAILAGSYHHIWFSQNARGYTALGFFALFTTHFLFRARAGEGTARDYMLYALGSMLGAYTHLTMVLVTAGQALAVAIDWFMPRRATPRRPIGPFVLAVGLAAVCTALAYLPALPGLLAHLTTEAPKAAAKVATGNWALAEAVRSMLRGSGTPAALLTVVLAGVGTLRLLRRDPIAIAMLLLPAVVTAGVVMLVHQPLRPRFFFFLAGPAAILAAHGVAMAAAAIGRRSAEDARPAAMAVLTTGLLALAVVPLSRNFREPKQDFVGAVHVLEAREAQGASIAAAGPACYPMARFYGHQAWPCLLEPADFRQWATARNPLLVYTLGDYIDDVDLRQLVRTSCRPIETFPGTLGGGDVVICEPGP